MPSVRRREIGPGSARSLLLTVLGEFALPRGEPVWTATLVRVLAMLDVEEKAVRQALARMAGEGWISARRSGRRTSWELTDAGRRLLTEGAQRIYEFGAPAGDWDGTWLLVLASVPETRRSVRHLLRTRLEWAGFGNLAPGVWVSTRPDREAEALAVLEHAGLSDAATSFVAGLGQLGNPQRVARSAWDLDEIELRYEAFLDVVDQTAPSNDDETLVAQVHLVQEWRRFPFLDPGLPPELLPPGWCGHRAAVVFAGRHADWKPGADLRWAELAASD